MFMKKNSESYPLRLPCLTNVNLLRGTFNLDCTLIERQFYRLINVVMVLFCVVIKLVGNKRILYPLCLDE